MNDIDKLPRLRAAVLKHIMKCGKNGATCEEVEDALGLRHQSASARVNELMNTGRILVGGRRETSSGRSAFVWVEANAWARRT